MKISGRYLLTLWLTLLTFKLEQASGKFGLNITSSGDCICPGHTLTFECTVPRGVGIIWRGSAFNNCSGSNNNEISLRDGGNVQERCNGTIVGRVVKIENGRFTSQLEVTISSAVTGKSIECAFQNSTRVGSFTTPSEPAPPNDLRISHIDIGLIQLTFSWSPVATDCPAIHYNILASNCGSCPTTTNHTTATCTNVPTDGKECTFAVQTVVCGNIIGSKNSSISLLVLNTATVTESSTTDILYFASIGFLAVSLVVSIVVIMTVVIIVLIYRLKVNVQERRLSWTDTYTDIVLPHRYRERRDSDIIHTVESVYDGIYDEPEFGTLHFKQNIAYSQTSLVDSASISHRF